MRSNTPSLLGAARRTALQLFAAFSAGCIPEQAPARSPATHILFLRQPAASVAALDSLGTLRVAFLDDENNIVSSARQDVEVSLSVTDTTVHLIGPTRASAVNGVATFAGLSVDKAGSDYRLVGRTAGLDSVLSATFLVRPGVAGVLVFVGDVSGTIAGKALDTVRVKVVDRAGNVDTTSTAPVTIRARIDTISGTITRNAVKGVATFPDLVIYKARRDHLLFATSTSLLPDTSNTFAINMAEVTHLWFFQQPMRWGDVPAWSSNDVPLSGTVSVGVPFHAQVALGDRFGNGVSPECMMLCFSQLGPVVPATIALAENPSGARLTTVDNQTQMPEHGYDWAWGVIIDKVGVGYTIIVTAPPYKPAISRPFSVVP